MRRGGVESVAEWRGEVLETALRAAAVGVAEAEALEEGQFTPFHAMILSPLMEAWREPELEFEMGERQMRTIEKVLALVVLVIGVSWMQAGGSSRAADAAASDGKDALRVYFADVEGGQATLFVTPFGESLLVDTGWPGFDGRDADRIVALCKQAAVSRIDNVLVTHYHTD